MTLRSPVIRSTAAGSLVVLCVLVAAGEAAGKEGLCVMAAQMDSLKGVEAEGGQVVAEGPGGGKVVRFDKGFSGRIDLKPLGIDPTKLDLLKIEVRADRGAFLRFSLENFPRPGALSHWYVLDTARGAFDWRTIWIDLKRPEEIKAAGTYKGMAAEDPDARGLRFDGRVKDLQRTGQGEGRSIWLGAIRFCNKAVDVDWDQTQAPYTWGEGKPLVYTYPLTVSNKRRKPVTAVLDVRPFEPAERLDTRYAAGRSATAALSAEEVALGPGESKTVTATITLPADAAAAAPPLYAERFEVRATARGIADSEVTILRSSDPIHLPVVVPAYRGEPEFPLVPHQGGGKPAGFNEKQARTAADAAGPDDLNTALGDALATSWDRRRGFNYWGGASAAWHRAGGRYLHGLTACAFLYDKTGETRYLDQGVAMLKRAAELWPRWQQQWQQTPYQPISHGIFSPNVLSLGWSTGSMRSAYSFSRHGIFNDFDLLAPGMDAPTRRTILERFIVPAGVHMRNHYFGLTNQQDVINYPILYAGFAGGNWPLAAFAYNAEHGVLGQLAWGFTDDGLAGEVNYHSPALEPITWMAELLRRFDVDLYNRRLYECIHSRAAKALGKPFNKPIVAFMEANRFGPEDRVAAAQTDGVHLSTGMTTLKWGGREVGMNWGVQLHRSSPDRCALRIGRLGGGNYTHSSLGQSILIVDENAQNAVPAEVTGVDVVGPVQYVQATSSKHYPGTRITRTFAILDRVVLAVDRVTSTDGTPHTVDWCLRYPGGGQTHADVAGGVSLDMQARPGSFTDKPADRTHGVIFGKELRSKDYYTATTGAMWRQANGEMVMAAAPDTQVMVFAVPAAFSAWKKERETGVPVLMVRRKAVKQTDFAAAFGKNVRSVQTVGVTTADGQPADAVGVRLVLKDGTVVHAIVNYGPQDADVALGKLRTTARFISDLANERP